MRVPQNLDESTQRLIWFNSSCSVFTPSVVVERMYLYPRDAMSTSLGFMMNLGTSGCVSYLFSKKGVIVIDKANCSLDEDSLMMLALEAGAEDFSAEEEVYEITTTPETFSEVREKLETEGLEFLEAGVQMVPSTYIALDEAGAARMERLIDMLEDLDDVSEIYHNWEE